MFKKLMVSKNNIAILGNSSNPKNLFFPGFRYRLENTEYTVKSDCTKDIHAPMREVFLSDGRTEIIPIEVLQRDIDDPKTEILEPDMRLVPEDIKESILEHQKKLEEKEGENDQKK